MAIINKYYPEVKSLRDVSLEMLTTQGSSFDPVLLKRCEYIIEENKSVHAFASALGERDFIAIGSILYEAHSGMQYKYEITCDEIDFMVDFTKTQDAVIVSRMMGGGFGGCTINLVHRSGQGQFITELSKAYEKRFGINMKPILVEVDLATSEVLVSYNDTLDREVLVEKLHKLGYPEMGNGSTAAEMKSYVSCAIGRMNN